MPKKKLRPVTRFLLAQLVFVFLIGAITGFFWGRAAFVSALIGGVLAMINVVGTVFAWLRILAKKDVALSLGIIVSKFALSIGVFFWLTRPTDLGWFGVVWFGDKTASLGSASGTLVAFVLGLCSLIPAALVVAFGDLSGDPVRNEDQSDISPKNDSVED